MEIFGDAIARVSRAEETQAFNALTIRGYAVPVHNLAIAIFNALNELWRWQAGMRWTAEDFALARTALETITKLRNKLHRDLPSTFDLWPELGPIYAEYKAFVEDAISQLSEGLAAGQDVLVSEEERQAQHDAQERDTMELERQRQVELQRQRRREIIAQAKKTFLWRVLIVVLAFSIYYLLLLVGFDPSHALDCLSRMWARCWQWLRMIHMREPGAIV